jgi:crossover junction endodeoxyribonuclease RuvC
MGDLVLGIDPGSRVTGYGLVRKEGSRLYHIAHGAIVAHKGGVPFEARLVRIYDGLREIIGLHEPTSVAVEGIFHQKNALSALKLGHARGVALLACSLAGLAVHEYSPSTVKKAVVGRGGADKRQVLKMVSLLLGIAEPESLDASDALAVAICHAQRRKVGP